MKLIVDTNLIFSALLRAETLEYRLIRSHAFELYHLQYAMVELFKYKEKILKYTKLTESEVYNSYYKVLQRIRVHSEEDIQDHHWIQARSLCANVDPKDSPYIAAALSLDAFMWTGDKKLRAGLEAKGFYQFKSTTELLRSLPNGSSYNEG